MSCDRTRLGQILLAALIALGPAWSAQAQRVLAVTNALSATREAARLYLQGIDFAAGEVLAAAGGIPGRALLGPVLTAQDGTGLAINSGAPWAGGELDAWTESTWLSPYHLAPLETVSGASYCAAPGWREWAACTISGASAQEQWILMLGISDAATPGMARSRAKAIPWDLNTLSFGESPQQWDLPGTPVCAIPLAEPGTAAILCHNPAAAVSTVIVVHLSSPEWRQKSIPINSEKEGVDVRPAAMQQSRNATTVFILSSGFSMEEGAAESVSWLHAFDSSTWLPRCAPARLPGRALPGESNVLVPSGDVGVWAVTRVPGTDFAYMTLVALETGPPPLQTARAIKRAQQVLSGVDNRILAAASPHGNDLIVAVGKRLEIWRNGERSASPVFFEESAQILKWLPEGPFLGESGRLHLLDEITGNPLRTVQLHTGWVKALIAAPPAWTIPAAQPWGAPRLVLPPIITFHGQAAGRELRVVPIRAHRASQFTWRITYDEETMPWLRVYPVAGTGPDYTYLFVDPAHHDPAQRAEGLLHISMDSLRPHAAHESSRSEVIVQVMPGRGLPRRILWIWPDASALGMRAPEDPRRLRALGELLAAPPHRFAHREVVSPFQEPLDPYAVVVIDAAAAAQGAITRQAVLDYVARGGALLFLGAHLENDAHRALVQWLRPIGIRINTGLRVEGHYAVAGDTRMTQYWKDFRVSGGCAIYAEKGFALEPGGAEGIGAVFVARNYGLGRIALLAAPTPLESDALQREEERRFASELFRWLGRAALEIEDMDGDGLPDSLEDINNNGIVDPGETDYRNPDTDGDGIPDGMEDSNRNGRLDDGETDPRNPDSDGDGIWDGADAAPVPTIGAPFLLSATPSVPAEGGHLITITGGNLTPDTIFWFGEKKATALQAAGGAIAWVLSPDFGDNDGGEVPLRAETSSGALQGMLPGMYRYMPRTRIHLSLEMTHMPDPQTPEDQGLISLRFEGSPGMPLGSMMAALRVENGGGIVFEDVAAGQEALAAGRRVQHRLMPDGSLLITMEHGRRIRAEKGELAHIAWRPAPDATQPLSFRIAFVFTRAATRQETLLNVTSSPLNLIDGRVAAEAPQRVQ